MPTKKELENIYDEIEDYGVLAEAEIAVLRRALKRDILKKVDDGKKPYIAAVLAGPIIDKTFKKINDILGTGFDSTLLNVRETLTEYKLKLTKSDLIAIGRLQSSVIDQLTVPSEKFKSDLKVALLQNVSKGMSQAEIIDALNKLYPAAGGQVKTLVNTSLQHLYKSATWERINTQSDYFVYTGPLDKVTRPFCRQHVGKVYKKADAERIQNEIMNFYNCRHSLEPVSKNDYEENPGEFNPEA